MKKQDPGKKEYFQQQKDTLPQPVHTFCQSFIRHWLRYCRQESVKAAPCQKFYQWCQAKDHQDQKSRHSHTITDQQGRSQNHFRYLIKKTSHYRNTPS